MALPVILTRPRRIENILGDEIRAFIEAVYCAAGCHKGLAESLIRLVLPKFQLQAELI